MTMNADNLIGAPVTDRAGLPVGTVDQLFRHDIDGTPSWARVSSAKGQRFVPLGGSRRTSAGGLSVPFDSKKIMKEPDIRVDQHMSVEQEQELCNYFGITVPAQAPSPVEPTRREQDQVFQAAQSEPTQVQQLRRPGETARAGAGEAAIEQEWLTRSEERMAVNLETRESGRVKLHKYVDTEPVDQIVRVFHEEYTVERDPLSRGDLAAVDLTEGEQEVILHEGRAVISKETVPVERVRLSVRKIEEDKRVTGELHKERIEVERADIHPESARDI